MVKAALRVAAQAVSSDGLLRRIMLMVGFGCGEVEEVVLVEAGTLADGSTAAIGSFVEGVVVAI